MEVTSLRPSQGLISRPALHQRSGNFTLATSQQGGFSLNVAVMLMSDILKVLSDKEKEVHWKCEVSGVDYPHVGTQTAASTGDLQWPAVIEMHPDSSRWKRQVPKDYTLHNSLLVMLQIAWRIITVVPSPAIKRCKTEVRGGWWEDSEWWLAGEETCEGWTVAGNHWRDAGHCQSLSFLLVGSRVHY